MAEFKHMPKVSEETSGLTWIKLIPLSFNCSGLLCSLTYWSSVC